MPRPAVLLLCLTGLAACTVEPLLVEGRPCRGPGECGPGTACDPARKICVALAADARADVRGRDGRDAARDTGKSDLPGGDSAPADLLLDASPKPESGCGSLTWCGAGCVDLATSVLHCGKCSNPCAPGQNCVQGMCRCVSGAGSLCGGCCDGAFTCLGLGSGQSAGKCGSGGAACAGCADSSDCTADACTPLGTCSHTNLTDGTSCNSGKGKCLGGVCCTGCVSGGACVAGSSPSACGLGGVSCSNCNSGQECMLTSCTSGVCGVSGVKTDGTVCLGGKCNGGSCCKGCISNGACYAGTSMNQCGSGGNTCMLCMIFIFGCTSGSCATGACKSSGNLPDGTSCGLSPGGKCYAGSCCSGCYDSATKSCLAGTANSACGKGGAACVACLSPKTCQTGACL